MLLFNHSEVDFEIKEGDRIAQLVIERIYTPEVVVVEELEESIRGAGGFGSKFNCWSRSPPPPFRPFPFPYPCSSEGFALRRPCLLRNVQVLGKNDGGRL